MPSNFKSNNRLEQLSGYIRNQILLIKEESDEVTYNEIIDNAEFKGYNLWILAFSMVLASIGLIVNSVAAIIGAMIISPLMGPIYSFAYALAIRDVPLKRKSVYHWIKMVTVSLLASSLFFVVSPFDSNTPLLDSFTQASFFDIMLAFFGGMAGFIGLIKKEGTKIIAGVAVATACMPPLCTAAYGIAHLDMSYFLGGMYYFLINCVFIGWGTFILTRFIYHSKRRKNESFLKRSNVWFWNIFTILFLIPAVWITYNKWNEENKVPQAMQGDVYTKKMAQLDSRIQKMDSLILIMTQKTN